MVRKCSLEELRTFARKKGGDCLSKRYRNVKTKLWWKCGWSHVWKGRPDQIKEGHWCPYCSGSRLTIRDMKTMAKSRGGACLSKKYYGFDKKLKWRCGQGHVWRAKPINIRSRHYWCPRCAGRLRKTIAELKRLAKSRGGLCLSSKTVRSRQNLKWKCANGHVWVANANNVQNGTWCPECSSYCSSNLRERFCRKLFERMFERKFPKSRPDWLKGVNGRSLELDGYCSELKLAFEYNGKQHYSPTSWLGRRVYEKQVAYDNLKFQKCRQNSVRVIEIPYFVKLNQIQAFVIAQCRGKGIQIVDESPIEIRKLFVFSENKLAELQRFAKRKGGKCLSKKYPGNDVKIKWVCKFGHFWRTCWKGVKLGNWCPFCAGNVRKSIKDAFELARNREGSCLSKKYANNHSKLKWACKSGHVWKASFHNVSRGSWCPECGKRPGPPAASS